MRKGILFEKTTVLLVVDHTFIYSILEEQKNVDHLTRKLCTSIYGI